MFPGQHTQARKRLPDNDTSMYFASLQNPGRPAVAALWSLGKHKTPPLFRYARCYQLQDTVFNFKLFFTKFPFFFCLLFFRGFHPQTPEVFMQKHATACAVFRVMLLDNIHLRHRLRSRWPSRVMGGVLYRLSLFSSSHQRSLRYLMIEPGPRTVVDVSAHRNKCEPVSAWPHPERTSSFYLQPIVCRTGP